MRKTGRVAGMAHRSKKDYDAQRYAARKTKRPKPPDPISTLDARTAAYLAGLLDGEGSFQVTRHKSMTAYPRVCLAMTHKPVMSWVAELLGGISVWVNNHTAQRRNPMWKPQYIVAVQGHRAVALCKVVRPYLRVKQEQADVILAFPVEARAGRSVRLDPVLNEKRLYAYVRMRELNARGRKQEGCTRGRSTMPEVAR